MYRELYDHCHIVVLEAGQCRDAFFVSSDQQVNRDEVRCIYLLLLRIIWIIFGIPGFHSTCHHWKAFYRHIRSHQRKIRLHIFSFLYGRYQRSGSEPITITRFFSWKRDCSRSFPAGWINLRKSRQLNFIVTLILYNRLDPLFDLDGSCNNYV